MMKEHSQMKNTWEKQSYSPSGSGKVEEHIKKLYSKCQAEHSQEKIPQ